MTLRRYGFISTDPCIVHIANNVRATRTSFGRLICRSMEGPTSQLVPIFF